MSFGGGFSLGGNDKDTNSGQSGGIFGSSNTNNGVGSTGVTSGASTGTGLFGSNTNNLFAPKSDSNTATGTLFGDSNSKPSAPPVAGFTAGHGSTEVKDGGDKPAFGFGTGSASNNDNKTESKPLFGSSNGEKPSGSLFGAATGSASGGTGSTGASLFGGSGLGSSTGSSIGTGGFSNSNSTGLFGNKDKESSSATSGGLFGNTGSSAAAPTSLFGISDKKNDKPATSLFGSKPEEKKDEKPATSLFGARTDGNQDTQPAGFSFNGSADKKDDKPATGLFSAKLDEKKDEKPTSSLFATKPEAKKDEKAAPFSFGGSLEKKEEKPGFSFNTKADDKKDHKPGSSLFGAKSEEKKDDKSTAGALFGSKSEEEKDDKPAGSSLGGSGGATGSGTSGASTAPTFGAASTTKTSEITPSSYMRNKSFEDIISKWTSALTKSTSQFKSQAADLQKWDRILVENGTKISETYGQVQGLEQQQTRIDDLLNYIDGQQNSLEQMLDKYEANLDAQPSARFDHLQPADQERRDAYQNAENLNGRLDDLESSLSLLISEINKVSQESSQIKDDDPIGPVLKILNSHLASMEWIEETSQQLQDKLQQVYSKTSKSRIPSVWS